MELLIQSTEFMTYIETQAPILFFRLDRQGRIREMNRFAQRRMAASAGQHFKNIIVNFHNAFDLDAVCRNPETAHPFTLKSDTGNSQTYQFHFYPGGEEILVFGHVDFDEIKAISTEMVSLNQELNNLTRKLQLKNRELKRANATIEAISRTDPLTELANRRSFNERIDEMVSMADRKELPLCLIMTDIDKFKRVNDTWGHDMGDQVLKGFARLMKETTRPEDLVARFGGEEFIILLEMTETRQAFTLAERIRTALEGRDLMENGETITASFGISQYLVGEGRDRFIKRTDQALYQAKTTGRNRSVISSENQFV